MGYYKAIMGYVDDLISPPLSKDAIEDVFCKLADKSGEFENVVFMYGVKRFIKRYKAEHATETNVIPAFVEIEKGKFVENPISTMQRVIGVCEEYYEACLDNCGEDDEANTIPAKKALNDAKKVLVYLETQKKLTSTKG